jgi:dolichol-phosphate mannosyltransferase
MKQTPISVILPTLNEQGNIYKLVIRIDECIHPQEIIIVDDNSTDKTTIEASKLIRKLSNIKLISNHPRVGLVKSIQTGIDSAQNKYVAWMDADFSHPPELLPIMWRQINTADIVVGSWLCPGGIDIRNEVIPKTLSLLINKTCQLIFGKSVTAYTSGFILVKKSVINKLPLSGVYGEYFIDLMVRAEKMKYKIVETPFTCRSRINDKTKTAPNLVTLFRNGIRYLQVIWNIYWIK